MHHRFRLPGGQRLLLDETPAIRPVGKLRNQRHFVTTDIKRKQRGNVRMVQGQQ